MVGKKFGRVSVSPGDLSFQWKICAEFLLEAQRPKITRARLRNPEHNKDGVLGEQEIIAMKMAKQQSCWTGTSEP